MRTALCCVFIAGAIARPAGAQTAPPEFTPTKDTKYTWREMWTGADAMRDVWLLYTGITLAPWSEGIYEPGWRIRAQTGYGRFDYELNDGGVVTSHTGEVSYVDALIGYHWRLGELTAKLFAGASMIERHGSAASRDHAHIFRREIGPKIAAEFWLNVGADQWTSLNLSYSTAHDTASARWRWGVKLTPEFAVGPELRFDTSDFRDQGQTGFFDEYLGRVGLFAAYKWEGIEFTAAGGIATPFNGTEPDHGDDNTSYYASVNVLFQY